LFRDEDHIDECMDKYPADFINGDYDMVYEHGSKDDVHAAICKLRARFFPDNEEEGMAKVFNAVWNDQADAKDNVANFVKKGDHSVAMSQTTFDEICADMGGNSGKDAVLGHLKQWTSQ
jgi:cytochrome c556